MHEHLITADNAINVYEVVRDRDGTMVTSFVIGSGYGIFRGQSEEEFIKDGGATFKNVGILVHYTEDHTILIPTDSNAPQYTKSHYVPQIGDRCTYRGVTYDITGVAVRPDINGTVVGYTIWCSNG